MAKRLEIRKSKCGNFCLAATLLSVPAIMGAAFSVDYGKIRNARHVAVSALDTAISASLDTHGDLDTGLARQLYASRLHLPPSQTSTAPVFSHGADGSWTARVTMITRLTFGGTLLPKTFAATVMVTAVADAGREG